MKVVGFVVALLLFLLTACSLEDDTADTVTCETNFDCEMGWDCVDGICVPHSENDADTYIPSHDKDSVPPDNHSIPDKDSVVPDSHNTPDTDAGDTDTETPDRDDDAARDEDAHDTDADADTEHNDIDSDESVDTHDTDETADADGDEDEINDESDGDTIADADDDTVMDEDGEISDDDSELPPAGIIKQYNFVATTEGWTHEAVDGFAGQSDWPYDPWDWTLPFEGPSSCHTDSACWVTEQKNYVNCQRAALYSPEIDLSVYAGGERTISFSFWQWYSFWSDSGYTDGGIVQASVDGSSWITLSCDGTTGTISIRGSAGISYSCYSSDSWEIDGEVGYSGNAESWALQTCTVPASLCSAATKFRFLFSSGIQKKTTSTDPDDYDYAGWIIDDITIEAK